MEKVVRGHYAVGVRWARQMPCLVEDREGFTQGSRGICRARRAHARQPRTSPSILLPIPYSTDAHCKVSTHFSLHSPPYSLPDGRPLHSVHALLPPFSSLFSTQRTPTAKCPRTSPSILLPIPYSTDAHCKVSTHFSLHSPPYSLPDGRPLHSVHALLPPFFSLLSTRRMPTA